VKIEVYPDDDTVARKAAAVIADDMRGAVTARGRYIMAVSGGRTPWLMLRALTDEPLPWQQVHVVQVDERVAPANDPQRNLAHLRASLLTRVPLPPDHIHAMPVARQRNTPRHCATWQARRRYSISFISASDPMATPRRWCLVIRPSTSPPPTSRWQAPTRAAAG
jgi:6-phosphogluconolactonase/glucosamine-6-phosphate isomerase/deaminase